MTHLAFAIQLKSVGRGFAVGKERRKEAGIDPFVRPSVLPRSRDAFKEAAWILPSKPFAVVVSAEGVFRVEEGGRRRIGAVYSLSLSPRSQSKVPLLSWPH